MKRRTTFLLPPSSGFDPQQLDVQAESIGIPALKAAREERWTASLDELSHEVSELLSEHCDDT